MLLGALRGGLQSDALLRKQLKQEYYGYFLRRCSQATTGRLRRQPLRSYRIIYRTLMSLGSIEFSLHRSSSLVLRRLLGLCLSLLTDSKKADWIQRFSEEEQSPYGVEPKALEPWKKMLKACQRFLDRTKIVVDREQPKEFQGMDMVEPLIFREACCTFASAALDVDLERADYRGEPKVPPFLPMKDDLLGELFWPLAPFSLENAVFMPYEKRCNHYNG